MRRRTLHHHRQILTTQHSSSSAGYRPADPTRRKSQRWSRRERPSTATPRAYIPCRNQTTHSGAARTMANIWFAAAATRTAGATSSLSVAPTARDAPPRTRPSRDSPSATWLSPPLSVRRSDYPPSKCEPRTHEDYEEDMSMEEE